VFPHKSQTTGYQKIKKTHTSTQGEARAEGREKESARADGRGQRVLIFGVKTLHAKNPKMKFCAFPSEMRQKSKNAQRGESEACTV